MAVFPGTDFKHGYGGYNNHKCRCDVCRAGAKAARERRIKRLIGCSGSRPSVLRVGAEYLEYHNGEEC